MRFCYVESQTFVKIFAPNFQDFVQPYVKEHKKSAKCASAPGYE